MTTIFFSDSASEADHYFYTITASGGLYIHIKESEHTGWKKRADTPTK
ncbi:hypothetical protein [Psychrobacillus sp. OK032]|nr:hypothetical protein [Psychrobacillus sp. OK032]